MKLAILLATYNGERFLEEQLASLLSQTYKDFELYIRDDGSTDKTLQIIDTFRRKYSNIYFIESAKKGVGAKENFTQLLLSVNADYYMFCDQDDVWFPTKIEETLSEMKKVEMYNSSQPVLIHTDLMVVDHNLNPIANSLWLFSKTNPELLKQLDYTTISNCVTGCTMMINQKAKMAALPVLPQAIMHDWWIAICVAKYGVIGYINKPMGLYRQHAHNTLGASVYEKNYILSKIQTFGQVISRNIENYKQAIVINKMSVMKYLYLKFSYHFKRRHFQKLIK